MKCDKFTKLLKFKKEYYYKMKSKRYKLFQCLTFIENDTRFSIGKIIYLKNSAIIKCEKIICENDKSQSLKI